jgi:natural product precursor
MKKKLAKKLLLNKSTVVSLNHNDMKHLRGGYISAPQYTCYSDCYYCSEPRYCDPRLTMEACTNPCPAGTYDCTDTNC